MTARADQSASHKISDRARLSLAALLLLIPLIDIFFFPPDPKEGLVGISLGAATFLVAALVYVLISRNYNPSWLRFASSSYDVTQISCGLVMFLVLNQPHTAVNSKVVFAIFWPSARAVCVMTSASTSTRCRTATPTISPSC